MSSNLATSLRAEYRASPRHMGAPHPRAVDDRGVSGQYLGDADVLAREEIVNRRPAGGSIIELDALLKPRSVAVLGASERPSVGRTIVENLERMGFGGEIYPINPRYETLLGRRCYRAVEELPDGVDVLAFCVNHERVLDGLRSAAKKRVRAAVTFDAGFAESDDEGRRRQDELVAICREADIAFCGPNCMGVISPHERSLVYLNALRDPTTL